MQQPGPGAGYWPVHRWTTADSFPLCRTVLWSLRRVLGALGDLSGRSGPGLAEVWSLMGEPAVPGSLCVP